MYTNLLMIQRSIQVCGVTFIILPLQTPITDAVPPPFPSRMLIIASFVIKGRDINCILSGGSMACQGFFVPDLRRER